LNGKRRVQGVKEKNAGILEFRMLEGWNAVVLE
jgi:hypothetical protein